MSLLPARSVYDYNCIAQIRAEVYRWTQKLRLLRSLPSNTDDKSQYLVRVETGTQYGADTGATISVTLFGEYMLLSYYSMFKFSIQIHTDV